MRKLWIAAALAVSLSAQVKTEKISWHGWDDALVISNPVAKVIVVPSIGRIMQFSFAGGEGPFWNERMLDGKPVNPASTQWANFGGDKSWPARQSEWPTIIKRGWPPPAGFDATADTIEVKGNEVILTKPIDAIYGIRERRVIRLDPAKPEMTVATTYEKVSGDPVNAGVWTITQLTHPDNVYMASPAGFKNLSNRAPFEMEKMADRVRLRRDPVASTKVGTDGEWMIWEGADAAGGKLTLKIERIIDKTDTSTDWPDPDCHIEVYTNQDRGGQKYVELEMMGSLRIMKVGDKASNTSRYTLGR